MQTTLPELQPIGACVIIENSQKEILVGVRKNSYKAGYYGFPGGRVEHGEPLNETIEREVFEETGISGLVYTYLGVVREKQEQNDFIHFIFHAQANNQIPQLCEPEKCEGWEWIHPNNLENLLPGHVAALKLWRNGSKIRDIT